MYLLLEEGGFFFFASQVDFRCRSGRGARGLGGGGGGVCGTGGQDGNGKIDRERDGKEGRSGALRLCFNLGKHVPQ